jgi:hypothetical protein
VAYGTAHFALTHRGHLRSGETLLVLGAAGVSAHRSLFLRLRREPCTPIPAHYVWWDTFAIPMGKKYDVTAACTNNGKTEKNLCPAAIQPYATCGVDNAKNLVCTETIPGYFKMRTSSRISRARTWCTAISSL